MTKKRGLDPTPWQKYAAAAAACALTALVATPLRHYLDLANIVMIFLLTVFLVAMALGRGPAVLAAFFSVALFDFFFVPPRLSFAVADVQYLVTFAVMLAVALVTGQLAAGMRRQADLAHAREMEARDLYALARDLAGAINLAQVIAALDRFLAQSRLTATLHLIDAGGKLVCHGDPPPAADSAESNFLHMALDGGEAVDLEACAGEGFPALYLPLKAPMRMRGVLAVKARNASDEAIQAQHERLATAASLVAIAVERLHYVDVAQETQVQMESERLRSSILSALSHDLRTPLTALVGMADGLALAQPPLDEKIADAAAAIRDQARAMSALLANLLDMARLHAGKVQLRKEWQLIEEVVGAGVQLLKPALGGHPLRIDLDRSLPLVEFDAVLIERVLCNLIENAAKYSPEGTAIDITANTEGANVVISVCDHGCGFAPGSLATAFDMFVRGAAQAESSTPGVGLGLAICKAIVEAHGGSIVAVNRPDGGACVSFSLPLGTPPAVEEESP